MDLDRFGYVFLTLSLVVLFFFGIGTGVEIGKISVKSSPAHYGIVCRGDRPLYPDYEKPAGK